MLTLVAIIAAALSVGAVCHVVALSITIAAFTRDRATKVALLKESGRLQAKANELLAREPKPSQHDTGATADVDADVASALADLIGDALGASVKAVHAQRTVEGTGGRFLVVPHNDHVHLYDLVEHVETGKFDSLEAAERVAREVANDPMARRPMVS